MKKVLVTGASGFLGLRFCEFLAERGVGIRAALRPVSGGHRKAAALTDLGAEIVEMELNDRPACAAACDGVDTVFHLAWKANRSARESRNARGVAPADKFNVEAMAALIAGAQHAGVSRFVFTSTVSVYGPESEWGLLPRKESDARADLPIHRFAHFRYYGGAKYTSEQMLIDADPALDYVILRPSLVYGPGANFASNMVQSAMRETGSGQSNSPVQWVHVDDVARSLLLSGERPEAVGQIMNIAGPGSLPGRTIMAEIRRIAREGDEYSELDWNLRVPQYDVSEAERILGFRPTEDVRKGLVDMVRAELQDA
ncbi:MAG: NAD-dependent epimerase/dehydratase family protein [Marinibacterium sp.]